MNLSQILIASQDNSTVQQAIIALEEYKSKSTNYLNDMLSLVFSQDQKVSYIATIQVVNIFKKYIDMEQSTLLEICQEILNNYKSIPKLSRRHLSQIFSDICAHLFFTKINDHLPTKLSLLLQESAQDVDLFIDYYKILQKLYTHQADKQLDDSLAFQLKILLENTQDIPLKIIPLIQQQQPKDQIIMYNITTAIIAAAYSWEDLPDYFEENIIQTITLLLNLIQTTGTSQPELQIEENSINVISNIIVNHFNDLKEYQKQFVDSIINYIVQKNNDQREYLIAKTLNQLYRWYQSPELGSFLQQNYTLQLAQIALNLLNYSESDLVSAQTQDAQFVSSYVTNKDQFCRSFAAENLLRCLRDFSPQLLQQLQEQVMSVINSQQNILSIIQLFKICVIQSQSVIFGINLVDNKSLSKEQATNLIQQYVQQIIQNKLYETFDQQQTENNNILLIAELFKFTFELFDFLDVNQIKYLINDFILSKVLGQNSQTLKYMMQYENQFLLIVLLNSFKAVVDEKIMKNYTLSSLVQNTNIIYTIQPLVQLIVSDAKLLDNELIMVAVQFILQKLICQFQGLATEQSCQDISQLLTQIVSSLALLIVALLSDLKQQKITQQTTNAYLLALKQLVPILDSTNKTLLIQLIEQQILSFHQVLANQKSEIALLESLAFVLQIQIKLFEIYETLQQVTNEKLVLIKNQLINMCLTESNSLNYPELSEVFFLFINNMIFRNSFTDNQFLPTKITLEVEQQSQGTQGQQLHILIQSVIQQPSAASYAYQTLNLLLRMGANIDMSILQNICSFNYKRINQLYNNKLLLKQVCLLYVNISNKLEADLFQQFVISSGGQVYDLLSNLICIGCQSAFTFKDRKQYICISLIKLTTLNNRQYLNIIKKCIGGLLGKVRNQSQFTTQEKLQTATTVCLIDGTQEYATQLDQPDPQDLDKQCLASLQCDRWT